jgi:hypothetical protein
MDRKDIPSRLIQVLAVMNPDNLDIKISPPDQEGNISFTIKHTAYGDEELAKALTEAGQEIISDFKWSDREVVGNIIVNKKITAFFMVFREMIDTEYEKIVSNNHITFGFGCNNKCMTFKMRTSLLYNVIINSVLLS